MPTEDMEQDQQTKMKTGGTIIIAIENERGTENAIFNIGNPTDLKMRLTGDQHNQNITTDLHPPSTDQLMKISDPATGHTTAVQNMITAKHPADHNTRRPTDAKTGPPQFLRHQADRPTAAILIPIELKDPIPTSLSSVSRSLWVSSFR